MADPASFNVEGGSSTFAGSAKSERSSMAARAMKVLDAGIIFPLFVMNVYREALVDIITEKYNYRQDTAENLISNYWFHNPIWSHSIITLVFLLYAYCPLRYVFLNERPNWSEYIFSPIFALIIMGILAYLLSLVLPSQGMNPNVWLIQRAM